MINNRIFVRILELICEYKEYLFEYWKARIDRIWVLAGSVGIRLLELYHYPEYIWIRIFTFISYVVGQIYCIFSKVEKQTYEKEYSNIVYSLVHS